MNFLEQLDTAPMVADGAMGTMLIARGFSSDHCLEELNLLHPATIQAVHQSYLAAGARMIETNTFGANRFALAEYGLEEKVVRINQSAVRIAREAREVFGQPVFIAGSVGPTGRVLEPFGKLASGEAQDAFREQIDVLQAAAVDVVLLETFHNLDEAVLAVRAAKEVGGLPVIAQMAFLEDEQTYAGHTPEQVVEALLSEGADVVGANCGVGPEPLRRVLERMRAVAPSARLSAMPNAGFPRQSHRRVIYQTSPEYLADYAVTFAQLGARLIGGCCGTTPDHIRAMAAAVHAGLPADGIAERSPGPSGESLWTGDRSVPSAPEVPEPARTELLAKLNAGKFVVSVELDPPKGFNPTKVLRGAEFFRDLGVDAINVADSPMARVRMGCLAMSALVQTRTGVETIMHFTCRDRNLMGLQSDLLGAHGLGVRNILALTGDPTRMGDYKNATDVYDVDSIGLISIIRRMNEGFDTAGNSIGKPARFTIGCALNPSAEDLSWELGRFEKKLEAGADFIMTQPLWDIDALWDVLDRIDQRDLKVPIVFGILPLHSSRQAEFLHNEVPGMQIPESVRRDIREAGDKALDYGIRQAQDLLFQCRKRVAGVYLMPSLGNYEVTGEVLKALA
ncbi:MAG TPA: bifunctional homocysteine S-methyltransferase/methylenetetrahydrofolate reductase [Armatimonadota bacterium]|nr:bifunctional homocysteine S-methyltransferase/methylenetetrahydrofolate reductase [Armatimonadota bacterium]